MNVKPEHKNIQSTPIKFNLVPIPTQNAAFTAWKAQQCIRTQVHHVMNPTAIQSHLQDIRDDLSCAPESNLLLNPLSHAHIAAVAATEPAPVLASNREDVLTQSQMLKTADREQFIQYKKAEIEGFLKFDVIDIHPIASLPHSAKLLSFIWSYRRKRLPNGDLLKNKSQICLNGKEQSFGRNYWETYVPVASWATIRMLLLLSNVLDLKT